MHRILKQITRENEDTIPSVNIEEILANDEYSMPAYLQKTVWEQGIPRQIPKTLDDISREVLTVVRRCAPPYQHKDLYDKLVGYRVVHELPDLYVGSAVKILKQKNDGSFGLQQMGIVLNIKFYDNGTHVICRVPPRAVIQFKYNEALAVFQKLSDDENMLLYFDNNIKS